MCVGPLVLQNDINALKMVKEEQHNESHLIMTGELLHLLISSMAITFTVCKGNRHQDRLLL